MNYDSLILAALQAIEQGKRDPRAGICRIVQRRLEATESDPHTRLVCLSKLNEAVNWWPDGVSHGFPVGGRDEYWDEVDAGTIWENVDRLRLLDWLIDHFTKKVQQ